MIECGTRYAAGAIPMTLGSRQVISLPKRMVLIKAGRTNVRDHGLKRGDFYRRYTTSCRRLLVKKFRVQSSLSSWAPRLRSAQAASKEQSSVFRVQSSEFKVPCHPEHLDFARHRLRRRNKVQCSQPTTLVVS